MKNNDNEAQKFDNGKPRYDLLPGWALEEVVKVLTMGAEKYGDRNWENGLEYGRCFAAAQRHMWAWWKGQDVDDESSESHLAHACVNLLFLLTFQSRNMTAFDNRPLFPGKMTHLSKEQERKLIEDLEGIS